MPFARLSSRLARRWDRGGLALFPDDDINKWVGIVLAVANFGWIVYSNFRVQEKVVAAVQVGQKLPNVEPAAVIKDKINEGAIVVPAKPKENV